MAPPAHPPAASPQAPGFDALQREVDAIARYITELRAAINGLGVLDMTDRKLSAAQLDINEVITVTRSATDEVLETAEVLMGTPKTGKDYRQLVEQRMVKLMETCTFQDLTGQRLTRVADTLHAIEERLKTFADTVQCRDGGPRSGARETAREARNRELLLNGPGSEGALAQDSIDDLMRKAG
jgi:chemotaxis protein CheZ